MNLSVFSRALFPLSLILLVGMAHPVAAGQYKRVDGIDVYYGVIPAAMLVEHVPEHEDTRPAADAHHLVVALFKADSGERIADAQVQARVEEPGHLAGVEKTLEPMDIAGTVTYGNYFRMSGRGPFLIRLRILLPGASPIVETTFEHRPGP